MTGQRATRLPVIAATAALLLVGAAIPEASDAVAAANTAGSSVVPATRLAPGLKDRVVGTVPAPTDIAFTPDGRGLVTTQQGRLRVLGPDGFLPRPAVDLSDRICPGNERGLLGVAVDPAFSDNHFIYVFWSFDRHGFCGSGTPDTPVNRVTRFRLGGDNRVVRGSATVIVDNIPSPATNHNAGDLAFGPDDLLYVATGDGGCEIGAPADCGALNDNARRLDLPNGKVLRVTRSGRVPDTNPFVSDPSSRRCTAPGGPEAGTGPCSETFAYGFRNPFRLTVHPRNGAVWAGDVGQDTWEEIDAVVAGGDYGWNLREGFCETGSVSACSPAGYVDPVFAYDHAGGCESVTGGAFVPRQAWNGRFAGDYLFADFICGSIWRLHRDASTNYVARRLAPAVTPVAMTFGPRPRGHALFYAEYSSGQIHRIVVQ